MKKKYEYVCPSNSEQYKHLPILLYCLNITYRVNTRKKQVVVFSSVYIFVDGFEYKLNDFINAFILYAWLSSLHCVIPDVFFLCLL